MKINRSSKVPLYRQIYEFIVGEINDGILLPQNKLEPERKLAQRLGVNRSTVTKAYQELKASGYIESTQGGFYRIAYRMPEFNDFISSSHEKTSPLAYMEHNTFITHDMVFNASVKITENKNAILFAAALSPDQTIATNEINEAVNKLINEPKNKLYTHCDSQGLIDLRRTISKYLNSKGVEGTSGNILIGSETMQLLNYLLKILVKHGDCIIAGEPIFPDTYQLFAMNGIRVVTVPVDDEGICTDQLEKLVKENKPKLIYAMPSFHNPTNATMSINRRKHLLEIAYKYSVPIIEDAFNEELQHKTMLPLKSMDINDYVIYIGLFNQSMTQGIPIAYVSANKRTIKALTKLVQLTIIQASTFDQYIINELLESGIYTRCMERNRKFYNKKQILMYSELEKGKDIGIKFSMNYGGSFVWCKLPDEIDGSKVYSMAMNRGISYYPGSMFYLNKRIGSQYMRLSFIYPTEEDILTGVKELLKVIKECK